LPYTAEYMDEIMAIILSYDNEPDKVANGNRELINHLSDQDLYR